MLAFGILSVFLTAIATLFRDATKRLAITLTVTLVTLGLSFLIQFYKEGKPLSTDKLIRGQAYEVVASWDDGTNSMAFLRRVVVDLNSLTYSRSGSGDERLYKIPGIVPTNHILIAITAENEGWLQPVGPRVLTLSTNAP